MPVQLTVAGWPGRSRRERKLVIMTASLIGMTLPSWASHLEYKLAPPPLLLVQAFVDTLDLDLRTDVLAHADEARAWLADGGGPLYRAESPDDLTSVVERASQALTR